MQHDELEVEIPTAPKLSDLDTALNELGMLATICSSNNSSTQEYLREIQNSRVLNMLSMNSRYVSNVSIGFRVRPLAPHVRYKPYTVTKREERQRTRSENNDEAAGSSTMQQIPVSVNQPSSSFEDVSNLKKAKSLESIVAESNTSVDFSKIPEMEIVSNCIEKLRVDG